MSLPHTNKKSSIGLASPAEESKSWCSPKIAIISGVLVVTALAASLGVAFSPREKSNTPASGSSGGVGMLRTPQPSVAPSVAEPITSSQIPTPSPPSPSYVVEAVSWVGLPPKVNESRPNIAYLDPYSPPLPSTDNWPAYVEARKFDIKEEATVGSDEYLISITMCEEGETNQECGVQMCETFGGRRCYSLGSFSEYVDETSSSVDAVFQNGDLCGYGLQRSGKVCFWNRYSCQNCDAYELAVTETSPCEYKITVTLSDA